MYSREEAIGFLDDMAKEWECSREQWETAVAFLNSTEESFECRVAVGNDAQIEIAWEEKENSYVIYIDDYGMCSLYRSDTGDFREGVALADVTDEVRSFSSYF